jgi:putative two-component system response regulator
LGKIHIKDDILLKPGKLTDEEFNMMKNHTLFGVKIIEEIERHTPESSFLKHAKIFAGTHHEKWDGSGYPYGLSGENIPLQGRLMAIADVYDALISTRPYKAPLTHEEAVGIIMKGAGTHFDPALIELFAGVSGEFNAISQSWKKEGRPETADYAAVV